MRKFCQEVEIEVRTFVVFLGTGHFSNEQKKILEVNNRNVEELDVELFYYGVRYFDQYFVHFTDGEDRIVCITPEELNPETYFFGGTKLTRNGKTFIKTRNKNVVKFNPNTDHIVQ